MTPGQNTPNVIAENLQKDKFGNNIVNENKENINTLNMPNGNASTEIESKSKENAATSIDKRKTLLKENISNIF